METAEEKRLRLARAYIDQMKERASSSEDESGEDDEEEDDDGT